MSSVQSSKKFLRTPAPGVSGACAPGALLAALVVASLAACGDDDYILGVYRGNAAQCAETSDTGHSVQVIVTNAPDSERVAADLITELSLPAGRANTCESTTAVIPRSATELKFTGELSCNSEASRSYAVDLSRDAAGNLVGTVQVSTSSCTVFLQRTDTSN